MKDTYSSTLNLDQLCSISKSLPVSYPLSCPNLTASIQQMGLITPLLIQPTATGKYQVICGHRRLLACQALGIKKVSCQVLDKPKDDLNILLLNLHDNFSSRVFNPIEQSIAINNLEMFLPDEQVIRDYLPLLGLRPHTKVRDKLAPLAGMEEGIKKAVVGESLHPDIAYLLSCLNPSERQVIFELFGQAYLSTSTQQELIGNLEALKHRDNTSIEQLIDNPAVKEIINHPELSLNQRGEQVRQLIHQWRLPLYSRAQQDFMNYKKELHLPPNMQFTPPPFFESDEYKLNISFKGPEELKRQAAKLEEISDTTTLQRIMKLGKEL